MFGSKLTHICYYTHKGELGKRKKRLIGFRTPMIGKPTENLSASCYLDLDELHNVSVDPLTLVPLISREPLVRKPRS